MKNRFLITLFFSFLMLASCEKTGPYINVDTESVELGTNGEAVSVNVSANCTWSLATSAEWIKVKRGADALTLLISASKNQGTESREGTVTLKAEGVSKTIKVKQAQMNVVNVIGDTQITMDSQPGQIEINVEFNTEFTSEITAGSEWLTIVSTKALSTKTITLKVAENNTKDTRQAQLVIKAEACQPVTVTINQTGQPQSFSYTVSGVSSFKVPSLDNKGNAATVKVNGQSYDYKAGTSLGVEGSTQFEITGPEIYGVSFNGCEGLDAVDFSQL